MWKPCNQEDDFMTSPKFIISTFWKRWRFSYKRYVSHFLSQCRRETWPFLHRKRLNLKILASITGHGTVSSHWCNGFLLQLHCLLGYETPHIQSPFYNLLHLIFLLNKDPNIIRFYARATYLKTRVFSRIICVRYWKWIRCSKFQLIRSRDHVLKWMTAIHHKSKYLFEITARRLEWQK